MDAKEIIAHAKQCIRDLFADEKIDNVGLEEIEFDPETGIWSVTIGFSRPWDKEAGAYGAMLAGFVPRRREYKVVKITDADKRMVSVKNRELVDE